MIERIDTGQCRPSETVALELIRALKADQAPVSREKVASYLGISLSTLKNYVRDGWLPEAHSLRGFKEKGYYQYEIDEAVEKQPWIKKDKRHGNTDRDQ